MDIFCQTYIKHIPHKWFNLSCWKIVWTMWQGKRSGSSTSKSTIYNFHPPFRTPSVKKTTFSDYDKRELGTHNRYATTFTNLKLTFCRNILPSLFSVRSPLNLSLLIFFIQLPLFSCHHMPFNVCLV